MTSLLLLDNFHPVIPTSSKGKESDELLYTIRSLVMVREPAQSVNQWWKVSIISVSSDDNLSSPQPRNAASHAEGLNRAVATPAGASRSPSPAHNRVFSLRESACRYS